MSHWTVTDSLGRTAFAGGEAECQRFAEVYGGRVSPPWEDPAIELEMHTADGLGGPRPGPQLRPVGREIEREHGEDPRGTQ